MDNLNNSSPHEVLGGKVLPQGILQKKSVVVVDPKEANKLYQHGCFGKPLSRGGLQLSPVEALFLVENNKMTVGDSRGNELDFKSLLKKFIRIDPELHLKYAVYSDLRSRGYVVKTGLKFGAHFRVYDRGERPGEAHSQFLVHAVSESTRMSAVEMARAVRLAHSVRKRMIWAVVDDEGDITYYIMMRERL